MLQISFTIVLAVIASAMYQSFAKVVDSVWQHAFPSDLVIVAVFFWLTVRPQNLSFFVLWVIGFVLDGIYQHPLGLNGLCLAGMVYVAHQLFDLFPDEDEKRVLLLLFASLVMILIVKVSLLVVLLRLEFSLIQFLDILVTFAYAAVLLPLRRLVRA